jgi:hypothetical protein
MDRGVEGIGRLISPQELVVSACRGLAEFCDLVLGFYWKRNRMARRAVPSVEGRKADADRNRFRELEEVAASE